MQRIKPGAAGGEARMLSIVLCSPPLYFVAPKAHMTMLERDWMYLATEWCLSEWETALTFSLDHVEASVVADGPVTESQRPKTHLEIR